MSEPKTVSISKHDPSDDDVRQAILSAFGPEAELLLDEANEQDETEMAVENLSRHPQSDEENLGDLESDDFDFAALAASFAQADETSASLGSPTNFSDAHSEQTTAPVHRSSTTSASPKTESLTELLQRVSNGIQLANNSTEGPRESDTAQDPATTNNQTRHVVFQIGEQLFGIPLADVREIDRCGRVTSLPKTPAWLKGVTNLRGEILSVTDFRQLLGEGVSSSLPEAGEKIIVVNSEQFQLRTALVVERIHGIRNLEGNSKMLDQLSANTRSFASSIAVENGRDGTLEATVLIDPDKLLGSPELQAFVKTS